MADLKHKREDENFKNLIDIINVEIEQAQVRAIVATNTQLLLHYLKLGYIINYFQVNSGWGSRIISQIAQQIQINFPKKKGYSVRNLKYMCQLSKLYTLDVISKMKEFENNCDDLNYENITRIINNLNKIEIGQEPLAQLENTHNSIKRNISEIDIINTNILLEEITQEPLAQLENNFLSSPISSINWASHVILMNSKLDLGRRYWYMKQSIEFGWSSNILDTQIKSGLYERQLKENKINNFSSTLPKVESDLANYLMKDPYIFDLLNAKEDMDERNIESQLATLVTNYLLEMGSGFAFFARQKHFKVGNSDFYADLILYNIKLHAYVVIELKATPFKPEYVGQLNFYVNVVDDQLRGEHDNKTIGLLLCRGKDEIVAKYALTGYDQPIGVSDYQLSKAIPSELKSALPTIEEVEKNIGSLLETKENK